MNAALVCAHLNLDVTDLARSAEFYRTQFDLAVEEKPTTAIVRWPTFLLVLTPGSVATSSNFHFGFRVDSRADVDSWFARFATAGVAIVEQPELRGSTYVGRVADPDGYVVEIFAFV